MILDKSGNNLLTSTQNLPDDSLTLTYNMNNINSQCYDHILDLNALHFIDSLLIKKYNGGIVSDGHILQLSAGIGTSSPVHTFEVSYHGESLGTIYFEYLRQHSNWQEAKVFTFNNVPAKMDSTTGAHIYVLQL